MRRMVYIDTSEDTDVPQRASQLYGSLWRKRKEWPREHQIRNQTEYENSNWVLCRRCRSLLCHCSKLLLLLERHWTCLPFLNSKSNYPTLNFLLATVPAIQCAMFSDWLYIGGEVITWFLRARFLPSMLFCSRSWKVLSVTKCCSVVYHGRSHIWKPTKLIIVLVYTVFDPRCWLCIALPVSYHRSMISKVRTSFWFLSVYASLSKKRNTSFT